MIKILLTIFLLICIQPEADKPFFASTGNTNGGTAENIDRSSQVAWAANMNDILTDDGNDVVNSGPSDYAVVRNFNFSIPTGATINGIFVRVEASENSGGSEALLAQLQDASGALFGTNKTTSNEGNINGNTKVIYTYGSTSDLWGATITESIVEDPDFGVRVWYATTQSLNIDFITMAVEYTVAATRRVTIISKPKK